MLRLVACLLLAAPPVPPPVIVPAPPPLILPRAAEVVIPKVSPRPAAFVNVTKAVRVAVPRGDHVHRCPCGNEWSHSTGNPGHVCQACGRVVTVINRWGPTTIMKTVTERVAVPATVQPPPAPRPAATVGAWVSPSAASYPTQPNCPT